MAEPIRVLLVDDDVDLIETLRITLEASGCEVHTANSGEEARKVAPQLRPDVVVLDVMMETPTEGFHVARDLRDDSRTSQIPIIMLTSVNQVMDAAYRVGKDADFNPVDVFLEKPIQPNRLVEQVRQLAKARASQSR